MCVLLLFCFANVPNLGVCYSSGIGVAANKQEGVRYYSMAAAQGYADAQSSLGVCYANGSGVAQNQQQAVKYFTAAAAQGYVDAQYSLGVCYANGTGVVVNQQEAIRYFKLAAAQGHEGAKASLEQFSNPQSSFQYSTRPTAPVASGPVTGPVVAAVTVHSELMQCAACDRDFTLARYLNNTEAADRLSEAAKNMNHSAEAYLAMCYYFGCHLFPQNVSLVNPLAAKSFSYLKIEVDQRNCYAQFLLGVFLVCGIGMGSNASEGLRLLLQAADQGHCGAQNTLGND